MMHINEIKRIIQKTVEKKGYIYEERKSVSTDSWYFKIYNPKNRNISLLFRVANHKANADVVTLRIDHKINEQVIVRFINNRCEDLQHRYVDFLFGII